MVESRQGLGSRKGGERWSFSFDSRTRGWRGVARPPPVCLHPIQDKLTIIITFFLRRTVYQSNVLERKAMKRVSLRKNVFSDHFVADRYGLCVAQMPLTYVLGYLMAPYISKTMLKHREAYNRMVAQKCSGYLFTGKRDKGLLFVIYGLLAENVRLFPFYKRQVKVPITKMISHTLFYQIKQSMVRHKPILLILVLSRHTYYNSLSIMILKQIRAQFGSS